MRLQPKEQRDALRLVLEGTPPEVVAAGIAASWIRINPSASTRIHLLLARDAWAEVTRLQRSDPSAQPVVVDPSP